MTRLPPRSTRTHPLFPYTTRFRSAVRLGRAGVGATRGSIDLDGNVLDADGLAREADARRRAGFEVELLKPAAVLERYGIKGRHALIGFGNYSADPRRMTLGYLNAAIARGARLYSPVDICDIDAREDGVTLHSARIGRAHV